MGRRFKSGWRHHSLFAPRRHSSNPLGFVMLLGIAWAQKLGPGDRIRIVCEQEPTLSVDRLISPEGFVELPLIGSCRIAGLYTGEAEQQIQSLAAQKLRSDRILIAITLINDDSAPIQFSGAVRQHGSIPFRPGLTLEDVVKLAEPTVAAATEAVEITMADGKVMVVNLSKDGGATNLRPGDRIVFPIATSSNSILILGSVLHPGSRRFEPELTLRKLIGLAGGITGHGLTGKVRLDRPGKPPQTLDFNSPDADTRIESGDVVFVPSVKEGRYVSVSGYVSRPGLIEFRDGMTLSDALAAAGGIGSLGEGRAVTVKRQGEWKRRYDWPKIRAKQASDLALEPDDIIEVPLLRPHTEDPKQRPKNTGPHPVVPPI